jgi:hypothetical protein
MISYVKNINKNFYLKNDYVVLKKIIDINLIKQAKSYLSRSVIKELRLVSLSLNKKNFNNKIKKYIKKNINHEQKSILSGQFSLKRRLSKPIMKIATNKKMIKKINKILLKKISFLHMPPMARFVIPENNISAVPPHQDISYNKHLSDFITVWIPLVKINNHSGCLRMFKKKYRKILKTKKVYNTIWNKIKNTGLGPYKDLNNLNLGDIVIFNKYKLHTSVPNNSNIIRFSLDLRFFFTRDQSSKSFYDISNNLKHVV